MLKNILTVLIIFTLCIPFVFAGNAEIYHGVHLSTGGHYFLYVEKSNASLEINQTRQSYPIEHHDDGFTINLNSNTKLRFTQTKDANGFVNLTCSACTQHGLSMKSHSITEEIRSQILKNVEILHNFNTFEKSRKASSGPDEFTLAFNRLIKKNNIPPEEVEKYLIGLMCSYLETIIESWLETYSTDQALSGNQYSTLAKTAITNTEKKGLKLMPDPVPYICQPYITTQ